MPILEYPPVPMNGQPVTYMKKAQVVQSQGLRFAYNDEMTATRRPRWRNETLHRKAKLEAFNVRLGKRARKIWQGITPELYPAARLLEAIPERPDKARFSSSLRAIQQLPDPIYRK